MNLFHDLIFDYTLRNVALGAAVLGVVSGALGTFAVLRKQSLLGDTISHCALPGIVLAFLATHHLHAFAQRLGWIAEDSVAPSKAPLVLMLGAALAGWIGTYLVLSVIGNTRIKEDSALGVILSVFFGFGLLLLTYLQKQPTASKAGLDKFLFGQAATLMKEDVITMTVLGFVVLFLLALFWKEFKLMTFNAEFGEAQGFPKKKLDVLLVSLLVVAIVIGLQTVGVVLMSAMVVIPPAAARQWTNRLSSMVIVSSLAGALAGVAGAVISTSAHMPAGPTVVLCMAAIMVFSLLFAPGRGLVWEFFRRRRNNQRFRIEGILSDLYLLSQQHDSFEHCHSLRALETMRTHEGVLRGLEVLQDKGWVKHSGGDLWCMTEAGYEHARKVADRGNHDSTD